jgi:hypothetical protein
LVTHVRREPRLWERIGKQFGNQRRRKGDVRCEVFVQSMTR